MSESIQDLQSSYIELSADIVAAYVSNNSLPASALGELLRNVHAAVNGLAASGTEDVTKAKVEKATPAEIKKISGSVLTQTPDKPTKKK